ncbi:MAG: tetratricopeptide repeat protein, partial [Deltaproteobacteria bacterium]
LEIDPQQSDQLGDQWKEAGVWLLWPLLFLTACAFRRGWLTVFIFCTLLTQPAQAFNWQQLWQRSDQKGAQAFAEKDFSNAAKQFQDPRWQAAAQYRNGNYTEAARLLKQSESADDWYNRGNALARNGQLTEAISAYDEALKINPQDQDALANKHLVEDALEQQQQSSPENNDPLSQRDKTSSDKSESSPQDSDSSSQESTSGSEQKDTHDEADSSQDKKGSSSPTQEKEPAAPDSRETEEPGQPGKDAQTAEQDPQKAEQAFADAAEPIHDQTSTEEQRATQQWLQRIPDDPGGLLRRKFLYQYRQRQERQMSDKPW